MNTGKGNFAEVSSGMAALLKEHDPLKGKLFQVGEIIKVKESTFRVTNISRCTLTLRLIPDENQQQVPKEQDNGTRKI